MRKLSAGHWMMGRLNKMLGNPFFLVPLFLSPAEKQELMYFIHRSLKLHKEQ